MQHAIDAHRLGAGQLVLEITETTLIADLAAAAPMLDRLHALGARIALDDFGTGYSSLSYLDALPVRLVKTDRSFIAKVTDAHTVPPLVAAIANLCTTLGLTGVAEGISSPEQHAAARNHGYRLGQGYLLGEPQPASQLTTRLHTAVDQTRATCPEPEARTNASKRGGCRDIRVTPGVQGGDDAASTPSVGRCRCARLGLPWPIRLEGAGPRLCPPRRDGRALIRAAYPFRAAMCQTTVRLTTQG